MSDYFDEFLDEDALEASTEQPVLPNWVSDANSSVPRMRPFKASINKSSGISDNTVKKRLY